MFISVSYASAPLDTSTIPFDESTQYLSSSYEGDLAIYVDQETDYGSNRDLSKYDAAVNDFLIHADRVGILIDHDSYSGHKRIVYGTIMTDNIDYSDQVIIHNIYLSGAAYREYGIDYVLQGVGISNIKAVAITLPPNVTLASDLKIYMRIGSDNLTFTELDRSSVSFYYRTISGAMSSLAPVPEYQPYDPEDPGDDPDDPPIVDPDPPTPPVNPDFADEVDYITQVLGVNLGFVKNIAQTVVNSPLLLSFFVLVLVAFVVGLLRRLMSSR